MAAFMAHDEERQLVALVSQHPELFDAANESYKNFVIRNHIWEDISISLGKGISTCKNKWRNIRDTYFKIRRNLQRCRTATGRSKSIKWHLFSQLQFLDAVVEQRCAPRHRRHEKSKADQNDTRPSAEDFEIDPQIEEDENESTRDSTGRASNDQAQVTEPQKEGDPDREDDENNAFFNAMAIIVRKLPAALRARARMDVHKTVFRYELEVIEQNAGRALGAWVSPQNVHNGCAQMTDMPGSVEHSGEIVKLEEEFE